MKKPLIPHTAIGGSNRAASAARRKLFVNAYLANGHNATQAALSCGLSPNGAKEAGARMMRHAEVKEMISKATERLVTLSGLTAERVLKEIERVAFSDTRKLYRPDGSLKRPDEWDDDTAAFVSSIEVTEEFADRGKGDDKKRELIGYTKKLKQWDKLAALTMGAKHLGLFERDNAQRAPNLAMQIVTVGPD